MYNISCFLIILTPLLFLFGKEEESLILKNKKAEKIREFRIVENDTLSYRLKLQLDDSGRPKYFFRNIFTPVWAWVAYIGGKRESRRIIRDHILNQMDIQEGEQYPDGLVTATWTIDLHFPDSKNSKYFEGQDFFCRNQTHESSALHNRLSLSLTE